MALPLGFVLEEPRVNLPQGFVLETAPPPPEKQSAFRQVADIPLGIAKGAVQGVRMIADAFGAGSDTSKTIKSAETYLADLMSAQAKNDQQEISRIMKDAEDKGVLDQVKAGIKAFTIAPVDTLSSALGTAAPVIAGALGAKILGAGALVSTGVSALTGAGMGAGVVKGSIYEETKNALKEAGASEQDAEARAKLAQEYGGKNLDQILLGTVLGGAAAVGPLEKGAAGILARRILGKTGAEATESVAEQAAKGAVRRRVEAGALEAIPEAVQAGQEQVAQNIALQREGFDVPTFRGAVSSATLEALAGAGLGSALGGGKPEVAPAPAPEAPAAPAAEPVAPEVETEKPMIARVMNMAAQQNGYGLLEQQKQKLLAEPQTEDTKKELTFIQEIQDRMNIETAQRMTPSGKSPFIVTPDALTELGIKPTAPIIKRLDGKSFDDPVVIEQLEKYAANKNVDPEVQQSVLAFVEQLRQPVAETPVTPEVPAVPEVPTAPPVAPAPVSEAPPVVEPPAPPVTPTVETPAPAAETLAPPVEAAAPSIAPVRQVPIQTVDLKTGEKVSIETQNSPTAFSNLVRSQFGEPQALVAKNKDGEEIGRLTYMPNGGPIDVSVREKDRRKGVATALYDAFEAQGGKLPDIESGVAISDEARAVRAAREKRQQAEPAAPPTLDTTGIKEVKGRHPQVQAAAKLLQDKKMTREEFEKYVDYYKPIEEIEAEKLLPPTSEQRMNETVNADKRDKINVPVADGTKVGLRMDLPARERGGSVVSIHEGKPGKLTVGKLMGFRSTGWLKDVTFEVRSQEKGLAVAAGAAKAPQQTVEGTWQNLSPEETYARVKELMKDPAWTQVGFDPSRHGYFYDRKTREPVVSASEMYQVGQFLLAKDVQYAPKTEFLYSLGKEQTKQLQDFQQTLRNLLNKFGLKDVGLNIVEGMDDAGSYSQQLIRIAAEEANPIRTLRHEAIHALRELGFFTDAQWNSLSKMAKDKWIDQYLKQRNVQGRPLKAGEESRYDAYMREYNGDMEKITEEAVADAFADFDATKPPAGLIQALLKRMKDLFQSIKSALTKVESPEQIFGKVEKGELKPGEKRQAGERKSVRNRATANFLRWFGDSKVVDEKGEPLVVYHGTNKDITDFKPGRGGGAIWFASTPELANLFVGGGRRSMGDGVRKGSTVYPVYLSIKKPLDLGNTAPQDNLSVAGVLRIAGLPADAQALRKIADANLSSGYAFVSPSNPDPAGYLVNEYLRPNSRASNTLDDPGLMAALLKAGFDGLRMKEEGATTYAAFRPEQIKSAIGNNGDYSLTNPDIRKSLGKTTDPGQQALETIRNMGMDVPKPDPTKLEKAKDIWQKAKEDPKLTAQSAMKAARDFMDKVETWAFSPDAKLNNDFRRAVIKDFKENEGVLGQLLEMSQSQAVHADALSSQFLIDGGLKYNDDLKKWESFESKANFPALSKKLDEIGAKYGLTKEQIERVAHTYLVAKRLPGLIERNKNLDAEIAAAQASIKPDKTKIKNLEDKKVFISDKQLEQIEPGLSLIKNIPELNQVVDMWNEIRKNTIDVMVNSGLWSPEYAQAMWDNMDYVPYFREDQIENEAGPQEFIRGLQVKSKEFQLKGSEDAVHDVFDNMIRWTQYAINRSVRAHKALQMVDNVKDIQIGDRKMAVKVTEEKRGMNIARVFRDGKQELYDMADPMYVQAFSAIQNVSIPTLKFMARVSNVLRQSVVLYPLFSVAQVPQDAFAAMFTSGLKTQHALKIPILAVKEFIKTLNKTSQTHETLKRFGATGVRDFSATVIRDDAEIYAGLKPPRGGWGKTKEFLSHISMAADNAVRQAVYEASMQQGVKQSEAIEKAFDLINFRRKGTSKMLNILGQTVPFFYAYLSAQRVALKVLTGTGISPTDRKEAFQTLATTSAAVATLSLLYAMANADDEDYMETPAAIRDRTITIPGSGGVRIPLRPDFFLFPKIIAEHTYLLLSEQGYQDAAKFRTSMKDALISAVASPTPFPTAIKPAIEVAINYDFFQGKPLIGTFEKDKALERQFRDSTSEFAKLLGSTGLVSPIAADHMIRGMFGSFGGLFLYGTNQFLHSDPDVPRPELNATEMLAALPGTSGLLKRPQESALKNDFYTLRDEVEKAVNTFNDIKLRSPQGMEDFLADEKNMVRLSLGKPVDKINRELSKIRKTITVITNMPESQMSAEDKADYKRQLMEMERELLRSVDVKALREMAKI